MVLPVVTLMLNGHHHSSTTKASNLTRVITTSKKRIPVPGTRARCLTSQAATTQTTITIRATSSNPLQITAWMKIMA